MKIFGITITTKKELRDTIRCQDEALTFERKENQALAKIINELRNELSVYYNEFPFKIGQTVYDLQLRNSKGRYTKKHPDRELSVINEVVVTEKNYFNLRARYYSQDVFIELQHAEVFLDSCCK